MELTWPDDAADARARSNRNLSEVERWASIAAGAGLAVYGLTRLRNSGWAYATLGGLLLRRGVTAHCDVYDALGMNTAADPADTRAALRGSRGINVLESVTINRPLEEMYRFWRNLENLPRFMRHLESVEKVTDTISHWRAKGPAGTVVEWDAEIHNEVPEAGHRLAFARRRRRRQRRLGELRQRRRRHWDPRHGPPAVQPSRRQGRRGGCQALRPGRRDRDP